MVEAASIDAVRSALAPVEELRGEQSQFETWVRESFAALESLNDELTEWQRDLARRQAALDQREAALADAESQAGDQLRVEFEQQLAKARDDARQLEEENAEQLQALDGLERQAAAAEAELRTLRKHAEELAATLDVERERASEEHRMWSGELHDLRRALERQGDMLMSLGAKPSDDAGAEADYSSAPDGAESNSANLAELHDPAARAVELRRRAAARRAHRRPS